ncbi:MAG: hypothetical protein FJ399_11700 [Verrucomicrobia bacterium]|nr:hypothetical protein [Verrucomicrobiota bacterium]
MSLSVWAKSGWLKAHTPTQPQVAAIFGVVDRDLEDSQRNLSPDGQFNIAYNAALQLCAIVLLAEGWKAEKIKAHYLTIAALPVILGQERQDDADYLDTCRAKRNGLEYDAAGKVSTTEAKELREFAAELREIVVGWLAEKHPELSPWKE